MSVSSLKHHHLRIITSFFVVALVIGISFLDPVEIAMDRILASAKVLIRHHEALGLLIFVVLSAISAIAFFFSTAVIVPVAVYAWGKPITMLVLWGSWLLGGAVSYAIGRHPGRRFAKWIVPQRRVAAYEKKISANANFPLVLLFQLAVPSEIPGYLLGAVRYHFGRYLGARALAEIPFVVGVVYLSDTFVKRQFVPLTIIAVGGILLSAVALYFLHKRIDR